MKWRLSELIGKCNDMGIKVTYQKLSEETDLSTNTLNRIGQNKAKCADLKTINRLLDFFSEQMGRELNTEDLLIRETGKN